MKHIVLTLFSVFLLISANGQGKQDVIASAGGYDTAGSGASAFSISWTLGETIIPTFQNGDLIITHGFQQQLIVTAVEENLAVLVNVKVFPNPSSDIVNIQFEEAVDSKIHLTVLDSYGKLMKKDVIEPTVVEKQINLQNYPAGIYYIRLTKGKLINVYKVVKL